MRSSGWIGMFLFLIVFVVAGCGGGLTDEEKKYCDDYVAKVTAYEAKKDDAAAKKAAEDVYAKITALKDDKKKAFDTHCGTKVTDAKKKFDAVK